MLDYIATEDGNSAAAEALLHYQAFGQQDLVGGTWIQAVCHSSLWYPNSCSFNKNLYVFIQFNLLTST